jgi:bifunctional non-homologous end joining protein LigD
MARAKTPAVDTLERYREKRDFARTREPDGGLGAHGGRSFVVHKHAARRLHYDLRLELDGVLKSWAVTRGPSYDPAEKRLAVHVEDHPFDYGGFEGTIPAGEYGGGTVMLWDRGTWQPLHDPREGLAEGRLHFLLDGIRLKGEWALIRMRGRRQGDGKRESWLLIKGRDGFAEAAPDLLDDAARSVLSGRTMAEIGSGGAARPARTDQMEPVPEVRPKSEGRRSPPKPVEAQLATLVDAAPEGEQWLHEIKYDGYRALIAIGGGETRLYSRGGHDWTARFHTLVTPALTLGCKDALIDVEVVVLDEAGRTSFKALQAALGTADPPLACFAFDLLRLDGEDLACRPLIERKERLQALLGERGRKGPIFYSDHVLGSGPAFFAAACAKGLEGTIAKRRDSPYRPGRGQGWLKIKCGRRQEVVIGGWSPSAKPGRPFASLLVGWHEARGRLCYAGRVGTGFDDGTMHDLAARLARLTRETSPFIDVPREIARDARWVTPRLVAEVAFTEWTADGRLRHPSFQALREDKPAAAVTREQSAEKGDE